MKNNLHEVLRIIFKWGSHGKYHNEPLVFRTLENISDSHLLHIIAWIKLYPECYSDEILNIMIREQDFRTNNYIFIPDYEE